MKSIAKMLSRKERRRARQPQVQFEDDATERLLMLQGRAACLALRPREPIEDLSAVEFRVFSQWGEDGILEWLVSNLPTIEKRFVEFGVESFKEANCRFLMMNRNWRGLVMDGSEDNMAGLRAQGLHWKHDLTAKQAFVTAENIDRLLGDSGFQGPLGVLSIDIDGNDYWVWRNIKSVDAAIVVCECNPILGDMKPVVVPYDERFTRFNAHYSGLYFGASIAALRDLAASRGYEFLGTTSTGINAFFVRADLAKHVRPLLKSIRAYPALHRDSRDRSGKLSFVRGLDRFKLIEDLPVINVRDNRQLLLRDILSPYSAEWLAAIETRP